jgi:hypothetical protein
MSVLQFVNHDQSIIVSSLSMPLRLLSEVESLLHHVSRPMKLARNDPFASLGRHETTAARQRWNAARPLCQVRPPHIDTLACGSIGGGLVSIDSGCAGRDLYEARKPPHQPGGNPARWPPFHVVAAEYANNWYRPSVESRRHVPQGDTGVRLIQVRITSGPRLAERMTCVR